MKRRILIKEGEADSVAMSLAKIYYNALDAK